MPRKRKKKGEHWWNGMKNPVKLSTIQDHRETTIDMERQPQQPRRARPSPQKEKEKENQSKDQNPKRNNRNGRWNGAGGVAGGVAHLDEGGLLRGRAPVADGALGRHGQTGRRSALLLAGQHRHQTGLEHCSSVNFIVFFSVSN